ncbi:hypothetical protein EN872_14025 [bacterium M00.F.Ca.ET.229.01.1.1]|nr:hypothetical protein EN872_14025 [bacterium M00.F.Ca.ET.229.01.1.1]
MDGGDHLDRARGPEERVNGFHRFRRKGRGHEKRPEPPALGTRVKQTAAHARQHLKGGAEAITPLAQQMGLIDDNIRDQPAARRIVK